MIAGNLDLLGMNQLHSRRCEQIAAAVVSDPNACDTGAGPHGDAQVSRPCFAAELATLDLERFLPTEVLRLFVREDFLGKSVNVDGP